MLKNWQSHQEYLAFLHEAKIHFDSSQRARLFPPDKNTGKPEKPEEKGQKAKERHKGIAKKIASRLQDGRDIPFNFERVLQNILLTAAVRPSMQFGLISSGDLTISGDGTCVHTHASPYGKRFKNCISCASIQKSTILS